MPIDFPNSPTSNQIYTYENRSWKFINGRWELIQYPGIINATIPLSFNESTKTISLDDTNIGSLNDSTIMNIMGAH